MAKDRIIKIAIYAGAIPTTTFIENLIGGLAKEGVTVYLFGKKHQPVTYPKGVKQFPTPAETWKLPGFVLKAWLRLRISDPSKAKRFLQQFPPRKRGWRPFLQKAARFLPVINHPPDVFHIQWAKMAPEWVQVKELMGCPYIVSFRGAHINYSPVADPALAEQYKALFPQIEGFHAVSHAIAREATQYGADLKKTKVVPPAVKEELLRETTPKKKENNRLEIVSIGRFHWKKGYHYALDALKMVKDEGMDFHYTIIAKGDQEEILYQIHDLGLENEVTIIPGMPHKEVLKRLKASDLILLSSVEEGIANVVLEAMAVGVPVVSTNCGGMAEVIEDGKNGWLVPVRDREAMARAIVNFRQLTDETIQEVIKAGRATIQEGFLLEQQVGNMVEFYEEILEEVEAKDKVEVKVE